MQVQEKENLQIGSEILGKAYEAHIVLDVNLKN